MIQRGLLAMTMLALALGLTACGSTHPTVTHLDLDETAAGPLAVDIENYDGHIDLRVNPKYDRITVESAVHIEEDAPKEQIDAILAEVTVNASIQPSGPGAVLRIISTSTHDEWDHSTNLRIRMPRCEGVRISNAGGHVVVVNASGSTRIDNRDGAIEYRTAKPITQPVTLTAVDGNIWYQVPDGSTGAFDLLTLDGVASYKSMLGVTDNVYSTGTIWTGTVNGGTNPVVLRTNDGDVWARILEDPIALTRADYSARAFWPKDWLYREGSRRYTQELPDDDLPDPINNTWYRD